MRHVKTGLMVVVMVATLATLAAAPPARQADYPRPTGTQTENGLAGFAKILCSAVFVSGRDPAEAAKNSAYFFMPRDQQDKVTFTIDRDKKTALAALGQTSRSAHLYGDQGCIIERPDGIHFSPVPVKTTLPDAASQPWPMGDRDAAGPLPPTVDKAKLDAALDAAFADPDALTAAFLVLYKGRIVAERYAPGITKDTQLESWSM